MHGVVRTFVESSGMMTSHIRSDRNYEYILNPRVLVYMQAKLFLENFEVYLFVIVDEIFVVLLSGLESQNSDSNTSYYSAHWAFPEFVLKLVIKFEFVITA
jgi:hypothetical protein